ncbi:MAG TPA: Nif3-like dinuclear metal center hexameric protein, partial [Chitinophagaceae bacterium]
FSVVGTGTFKAGEGAHPFVGSVGTRHEEAEIKLGIIFPAWLEGEVIEALKASHPYEEVAFDVIALSNSHQEIGSGLIGVLPEPMTEQEFLRLIAQRFNVKVIRHTVLPGRPVKMVALCGGAGSFLIGAAAKAGADFYVTSDVKYHEFFDADGRLVIADIGHFESEQFTIDLLVRVLEEKFPNFAVLKTRLNTNPVRYYTAS